MQDALDKMKEAYDELAEACARMQQDGAYNNVKRAQVALSSAGESLANAIGETQGA
jgi:hypothetical protein